MCGSRATRTPCQHRREASKASICLSVRLGISWLLPEFAVQKLSGEGRVLDRRPYFEGADYVDKHAVRAWIEDVGIIPAVRVSSADDALFAAEAIARGGIPIVEITLTVSGAIKVISHLRKQMPDMVVGAGGVMDATSAQQSLDAGAQFLTSDGL